MLTLDEIKTEAENMKEILSGCKTIEDLVKLRHKGINQNEIQIEVLGWIELDDYIFNQTVALNHIGKNADEIYKSEVNSMRIISSDSCISYPTYSRDGAFFFDVYDSEIDDEFPIIEDATLETIDELYSNFYNDYQMEDR